MTVKPIDIVEALMLHQYTYELEGRAEFFAGVHGHNVRIRLEKHPNGGVVMTIKKGDDELRGILRGYEVTPLLRLALSLVQAWE